VPLHKTGFSKDPDFPITSSSVFEIVGTGKVGVSVGLSPNDQLPENGILMGDVTSVEDLACWADKIDKGTLPAGASGFFYAICHNNRPQTEVKKGQEIPFGNNVLFVLGSSYPKDAMYLCDLEDRGIYISNMPKSLYDGHGNEHDVLDGWANDI